MPFALPDLPYGSDALEPSLSARTLEFHHGKHHRGYVDKLNSLVAKNALADRALEEIIHETAGDDDARDIFNNAAQVWNHSFFWKCLSPTGGGRPQGELGRLIDSSFGSFQHFVHVFKSAATGQFGSGWAWLVLEDGQLRVTATPNAVPPLVHGQQPLLTCDVWEHAYYLDYQNDRAAFVDAFLGRLAHWDFAAEQLALHAGPGAEPPVRSTQPSPPGPR